MPSVLGIHNIYNVNLTILWNFFKDEEKNLEEGDNEKEEKYKDSCVKSVQRHTKRKQSNCEMKNK